METAEHDKTFESFDELLEFVKDWRIWSNPAAHEYDAADNLREFALDAELADIPEFLQPEQVLFLKKFGKLLEQTTEE